MTTTKTRDYIMKASEWITYIRSYCEDAGVTLITNTDQVMADVENKIIYCPMPDETDEQAVELSLGFIKHEMAHMLYSTSFNDLATKEEQNDGKFHTLCNAIEDARVEKELGSKYLGIKDDFEKTLETLTTPLFEKLKSIPYNAEGMGLLLREYLATGSVSAPEEKIDAKLKKLFEENKEDILKTYSDCKNTEEMMNLAREIYKWFPVDKKESKEQQEQKEKDKKDKKMQGAGAKGSGKGEKKEGDKEKGKSESEGEGESEKGESKEEKEERAKEELKEIKIKDIADLAEGLKKMIAGGLSRTYNTHRNYRFIGKVNALKGEKLIEYLKNKTYGGDSRKLPKENPIVVNSLRRVIMNYLTAKARNRTLYNFKKGKIATRHLHRTKFEASPKIFKKKLEGTAQTVDICILVDWSGSMCHGYGGGKTNIALANELMINMNEALHGIKGINYSIAGYSTGDHTRAVKIDGVSEDVNLYVVKEFGKKFNTEGMALSISGGVNHNNNDYESVKWAYRELIQQKNSRKILFVIADGYPACSGVDGDVLDRLTKEAIQFCWKRNVEVYGFGIGHDLSELFDHFTMVDGKDMNIDIANNLKNLITKSGR